MRKVRVAEFFGEPLNYGGQEAFVRNVYSNIDKKGLDFTFITPFECENTQLAEMIRKNGDKLVAHGHLFENKLRKRNIITTAKKILSDGYDIVHIHSGSIFTLLKVSKIAKKYGVKKVIVHSHATGRKNLKYRAIKALSDAQIEKYADIFFACSRDAAVAKFPNSIIERGDYRVIKNGINLDEYVFNDKIRNAYRDMLGVTSDTVLLGNVGRLSIEKNQIFIIKLLKHLNQKRDKKYKLLLVGEGPLEKRLVNFICSNKLDQNVILLKRRDDVSSLLMAMDVFLFPSLFEGLGIALIEAEAVGTPSLCSAMISEEAVQKKNCFRMNTLLVDDWAKKIKKMSKKDRDPNQKCIRNSGYDIRKTCEYLKSIYCGA